jgi:hypothetical protein
MVAMSQVKGHCKLWVSMLVLSAAFAGGCARRLDLTTDELKRIEDRDEELKTLRVVPKRKLISLYREDKTDASYDVSKRKITERGAYRPYKRIVGRKTAGKVVSRTEQNGMPVFWIAFDNKCADTACAYGFVLTELGRYTLFQVPDREKYQSPENYRRNTFKRNRLKLVKQKSLAEANEVFAATRKRTRGRVKVLTIDLQIRKDVYRPTRADVDRASGAD